MKNIVSVISSALLLGGLMTGCSEDFLKGEDNSLVTSDDKMHMSDDKIIDYANSDLGGIYSLMYGVTVGSLHSDFGWASIYLRGDHMTDDLAMHTQGSGMYTFDYALDYWKEQYVPTYQMWTFFYSIISNCNLTLASLPTDNENIEIKAIRGQLLALRGFSYFYLAQLYQQTYFGNEGKPGCPLYLTEAEGESIQSRATVAQVYAQIDKDFKQAVSLLEGWKSPDKVHIDQAVASALYARVCLVKHDWDNALSYAQLAQKVTSARMFTSTELLTSGFNDINAVEWMWGSDITPETSTMFASFMSFMSPYEIGYGGSIGCYRKIDAKLFSQMNDTDVRRSQFKDPSKSWSGAESVFPAYTNLKFKKVANWGADYVYMRYSELVLIEAEAYAQKGNYGDAAKALARLMVNRDPSWNKSYVSVDDVYQQRRLELWGEGFSLFDHIRLKKGIDRTYSGSNHYQPQQFKVEAGSWFFLFQIPKREIDNNNSISQKDQNPIPSDSERVKA